MYHWDKPNGVGNLCRTTRAHAPGYSLSSLRDLCKYQFLWGAGTTAIYSPTPTPSLEPLIPSLRGGPRGGGHILFQQPPLLEEVVRLQAQRPLEEGGQVAHQPVPAPRPLEECEPGEVNDQGG